MFVVKQEKQSFFKSQILQIIAGINE